MKKLIIKSVYIPVIGIFIGLWLITDEEYGKLLLREKHSVAWMLISHIGVLDAAILIIGYFVIK
jgi:hypothetical protein